MNFDGQGHVVSTPTEIYDLAVASPHRLLNAYLMQGTPHAFGEYRHFCDFLEAVSDRTGVHTRNLYVRGSCHIGFSIAPNVEKVWFEMDDGSDLDLVIVDLDYFQRCETELHRWEVRNPVRSPEDRGAKAAANRAQDRQFNCFRDKPLPNVVCVHHRKMMQKLAALAHCGHERDVSAFVYPDWHSAQLRYEFDLKMLCEGVAKAKFPPPPNVPFSRMQLAPPAATLPNPEIGE